jgi:glucose-6-phosphate isomerase
VTAATKHVQVADDRHAETLASLIADQVASRLAAGDATLWGPDAEPEASIRLGWVNLPESSRPLIAEIEALRAELSTEGVDRVVLCGMGGSSLAPEVITQTAGVNLLVLDSTDPAVVRRAISSDLTRTVVVVSSKSGSTVETDSQRRAFEAAFEQAGIDAPSRFVAVTDPGSGLADLAAEQGFRRTFLADPNVGGRYSALSAFGLVPSGLAGVDIGALLDDAAAVMPALSADDESNPGLLLGAALGAGHQAGRDKVVIADTGSGIEGFGAWAEQLVAESTGKEGRGLLPVDLGSLVPGLPGWRGSGPDVTRVALVIPDGMPRDDADITTGAPLGALMQIWEFAIAVAGRVIGINPFDQPNVEEAKASARALLDQPASGATAEPSFTDGAVEVYGAEQIGGSGSTLAAALEAFVAQIPDRGYAAILAYLDRDADAAAADLRARLAHATSCPVTFGWGPRYLHSTGQYHKGGHPNGAFLEITGVHGDDLEVPGRPYSFGTLIDAQSAGDLAVLADRGRPTLRLHLTDRTAGLAQLSQAADAVARSAGSTTR